MDKIQQAKSISIWIFLIPFISVNTCLILITEFQWIFPNQEDIIHNTIPYFDGGASISRTVRPYPSWLIFKPAMFLTSFLLIKYWYYNRDIILDFDKNYKHIKKIIFFGVGSAIALTIHSIFLGIEFDNNFEILSGSIGQVYKVKLKNIDKYAAMKVKHPYINQQLLTPFIYYKIYKFFTNKFFIHNIG